MERTASLLKLISRLLLGASSKIAEVEFDELGDDEFPEVDPDPDLLIDDDMYSI